MHPMFSAANDHCLLLSLTFPRKQHDVKNQSQHVNNSTQLREPLSFGLPAIPRSELGMCNVERALARLEYPELNLAGTRRTWMVELTDLTMI